ncbi:helix-turn-helix domain-containing protein [Flavihumibacter stibioxidans]|uniref:helix-turn-helix domain-containing protein n=1 Tax=Flavihumibacter stibioxidans TaxID=1834163 RepID=UPI0031B5C8ED
MFAALGDKKGWSQTDLAAKSQVSRVMIGKYERDEAVPSIDAAKKITDALEDSLDHLVVEGVLGKSALLNNYFPSIIDHRNQCRQNRCHKRFYSKFLPD